MECLTIALGEHERRDLLACREGARGLRKGIRGLVGRPGVVAERGGDGGLELAGVRRREDGDWPWRRGAAAKGRVSELICAGDGDRRVGVAT